MSRGRNIGRIKNIPPDAPTALKYLSVWRSGDLYRRPDSFPRLISASFFGDPQPLQIEAGCGTGEFICHLATEKPDNHFIGVDFSRRAIYHAVDQARKKELENIHFIHADFKLTYPLMEPETIKALYLHFPDPNYGSRFRKHRIFNQDFLDAMNKALTPSGIISFVTDQEEFFFETLEIAEADSRFRKAHPERYLDTYDAPIKSRFQKAWERKDRTVFRFELTKS